MPSLPDCLFVIDTGYEKNAIAEAKKLGIPVIAVVDTNNDPQPVDWVIPGNDDATRAIKVYTACLAEAILEGRGSNPNLKPDEYVPEPEVKMEAPRKPRPRKPGEKDGKGDRPSRGRRNDRAEA
jgi:small subunit ribosomal protein S2